MYDTAHIGIVVKNVERSVEFYSRVLKCEAFDSYEDDKIKIVFLKSGCGTLEIIQYIGQEDAVRSAGVVDHIAFSVSDLDRELEMLKQNNVPLVNDMPRLALGGSKKVVFFLGPDGERLEFTQNVK